MTAQDYIITMKNGRLGAIELPDDKTLLREVTQILTDDYLKHGGTITRK
jgi:hypothetical protein